ncbi:OmpA family protein [Spirosoma endbachense]|uniref:OmpA family protein n=1 Tax=Spirosoma endbachense TaxID=2666025 RepID=A0A6P1VXA1_9BACT|nr:OmpA family protein [Spirosoma endbachense]QHV96417.1 OmpA family protein [Spirosoma endbachense]
MFANKTPWIVLLVLWMIGSTWWHVCKIKQLCADDAQPTAQAVAVEPDLETTPSDADGYTIADGSLFRLELPGNFSFAKSGANANINTLGGSLESMVTYLKANPGRMLDITGYYSLSETNTSTFANLGLARAEGIKQYLIQQGIPAASITTKGVERNLSFTAKGDSLRGGLDFAFSGAEPAKASTESVTATSPAPITLTAPTTEADLAASVKFKSVFEPIDLYFPLGEANYIKTPETKKFFDEAAKYLTEHKDKKLRLTGYTDNSGPDDVNMRLSRDRANDVKLKLRKSGINNEQIIVQAKGEADPKADNSTISGRKANRRVTVVVIQ